MSTLALVLVIVSAILHAGWNYIGKTRTPTAAFFAVANATGFVVLLPLLLMHHKAVAAWPDSVWGWIVLTGAFQAIYCGALARAYRAGDISVAYPLARSSPVLVVMVTTFLLGR
ncbi:MAG: multidrug DMT transporter permease, partial [Gemmatimonadetes bacterium]|nr:multidrug DMT transporter permease [Gemmatimonadota bacterium]